MSALCGKSKVKDEDASIPTSEDDEHETCPQSNYPFGEDNNDAEEVAPGFTISGSIAQFHAGTLKTASHARQFSVPMSWHNLCYEANGRKILRNLTGTALPSRCLAIMGSSGAGKTTFLNAISDRLATSHTLKLKGSRQLGEVEYRRHYRKVMGFVAQDDILSPLATPDGALRFSLRVRRGLSVAETLPRVEDVLQELRLMHCRDTVVGIPGLVAGLSGGERKRCSIGVELICDPKILMLDEPTSGLDSVTSAKIVHLLNELSRTGRTVIYTIHQPTAETLTYFDDLMLLAEGRCVYHGTMVNAVPYFDSIGFPCPETFTPTDYFMTLLQDPPTARILSKKWKKLLKSGKRTPHSTAIELHKHQDESSTTKFLKGYINHFDSPLWVQFVELVRRNSLELSRNRMLIFSHISQALFFSLIVGLIFLNMGGDIAGIQDREGMLFMTCMNRAMGPAFLMINTFPRDRPLFIREQQIGAYSPFMFFIAKMVVDFPLRVFSALLECSILYWMVGLTRLPGPFFYYFGVVALLTEVASAFGFAVSASCPNLVVASAITPMILLPLALAGGLLASTTRLRPYWYWLEKPSFVRHAYILTMRNEFKHIDNIKCDNYANGDNYCFNQPKSGMEVLTRLGFEDAQSLDWMMWISLLILYIIFCIIIVIALSSAARSKF